MYLHKRFNHSKGEKKQIGPYKYKIISYVYSNNNDVRLIVHSGQKEWNEEKMCECRRVANVDRIFK